MAKTLSKPAAIELRDAEVDYLVAKQAFDAAKAERDRLRKKHQASVPYGTPVDASGYEFARSSKPTGQRFSLSGYIKAGKKVTAAMRPFVSKPGEYDVWEITAVETDVPSIEALVKARAKPEDSP